MDTIANRYWVGGTGNWSDNTNHWSDASGGSPGASKPTSSDNVYFDANSFSEAGQIVTVDEAANCLDMDWTGATNSPTLAGTSNVNVYGNIILISNMTWTKTGNIRLYSDNSVTIKTYGITATSGLRTDGTGTYTLQDNFSCANLQFYGGVFATNNKEISCTAVSSNTSNSMFVNLGNTTLNCSGSFTISITTNFHLDAGTSTIIMTGDTKTFAGGGLTYNNVELQGTPTTITGSNTFNELKIASGKTANLTAGTAQTVTSLAIDGATLQSTTAGSAATISKASGTLEVTGATIKDITATGGATFIAINSINVSGNTGWTWIMKTPVPMSMGMGMGL